MQRFKRFTQTQKIKPLRKYCPAALGITFSIKFLIDT